MNLSTIPLAAAPEQASASSPGHLSPDITAKDVEFYRENGYLVVEDALSPAEIDELRHEAVRICRGELGAIQGVPTEGPLSAGDSESTVKVNVQAPDAAGAARRLSDDEFIKQFLCIHNPHKISAVMRRYMAQPTMVKALTGIIGPNVKAMQSMLFIKASGKPGQAWHQDEYYIPTRDRSLCSGWMALDRATVENGCLWVIPGSHKHGILWPQHWHGDRRFDCGGEAFGFPYRDEDGVPVEVQAGAIVFFNGYLLHRSLPNRARAAFRRSLVNHYMSAESLLPWQAPKDGQSVATTDFRDIFMVAGKDPYAYKGTENLLTPSVRPSGEGGCLSWGTDKKYTR